MTKWSPQSIWDYYDLDDEACEILARGGQWRLPEPLGDWRPGPAYEYVTQRIAHYKAEYHGHGEFFVYGKWEGDEEWIRVGGIQAS